MGPLRLTPDEWMIPLFGESEAGGKRDVLEGRLITLAVQLLRLGTSVVLDFGCWAKNERSALRWLAEREGASFRLVYVSEDRATELKRIEQRRRQAPDETFAITISEVDRWRDQFEVPRNWLARTPPSTWTLDWLARLGPRSMAVPLDRLTARRLRVPLHRSLTDTARPRDPRR